LDRLLPTAYAQPAPALRDLAGRVPTWLVVPGEGRAKLTDEDKAVAAAAVIFVMGFVAEFLPAQVTCTDAKSLLPGGASELCVRGVGGGHQEFIGGVDLLLRVHASRPGTWHAYDKGELMLDVKLTGVAGALGANGPTVRSYVEQLRRVLEAARGVSGARLGGCQVAGLLLWRPPGPTFDGAQRQDAHGFIAFDADRLLSWNPASQRLPGALCLSGKLLVAGRGPECGPESLPTPSLPAQPLARDRWAELAALKVKQGWVVIHDFVKVFELGRGGPVKRISERVCKRLRGNDLGVEDHDSGSRGRPNKRARISELRQVYPHLK
jgi:hypothetical protein